MIEQEPKIITDDEKDLMAFDNLKPADLNQLPAPLWKRIRGKWSETIDHLSDGIKETDRVVEHIHTLPTKDAARQLSAGFDQLVQRVNQLEAERKQLKQLVSADAQQAIDESSRAVVSRIKTDMPAVKQYLQLGREIEQINLELVAINTRVSSLADGETPVDETIGFLNRLNSASDVELPAYLTSTGREQTADDVNFHAELVSYVGHPEKRLGQTILDKLTHFSIRELVYPDGVKNTLEEQHQAYQTFVDQNKPGWFFYFLELMGLSKRCQIWRDFQKQVIKLGLEIKRFKQHLAETVYIRMIQDANIEDNYYTDFDQYLSEEGNFTFANVSLIQFDQLEAFVEKELMNFKRSWWRRAIDVIRGRQESMPAYQKYLVGLQIEMQQFKTPLHALTIGKHAGRFMSKFLDIIGDSTNNLSEVLEISNPTENTAFFASLETIRELSSGENQKQNDARHALLVHLTNPSFRELNQKLIEQLRPTIEDGKEEFNSGFKAFRYKIYRRLKESRWSFVRRVANFIKGGGFGDIDTYEDTLDSAISCLSKASNITKINRQLAFGVADLKHFKFVLEENVQEKTFVERYNAVDAHQEAKIEAISFDPPYRDALKRLLTSPNRSRFATKLSEFFNLKPAHADLTTLEQAKIQNFSVNQDFADAIVKFFAADSVQEKRADQNERQEIIQRPVTKTERKADCIEFLTKEIADVQSESWSDDKKDQKLAYLQLLGFCKKSLENPARSFKDRIRERQYAVIGPYGYLWNLVFEHGFNVDTGTNKEYRSFQDILRNEINMARKLLKQGQAFGQGCDFDGLLTADEVRQYTPVSQHYTMNIKEYLQGLDLLQQFVDGKPIKATDNELAVLNNIVPKDRIERESDAKDAAHYLLNKFYLDVHLRKLLRPGAEERDDDFQVLRNYHDLAERYKLTQLQLFHHYAEAGRKAIQSEAPFGYLADILLTHTDGQEVGFQFDLEGFNGANSLSQTDSKFKLSDIQRHARNARFLREYRLVLDAQLMRYAEKGFSGQNNTYAPLFILACDPDDGVDGPLCKYWTKRLTTLLWPKGKVKDHIDISQAEIALIQYAQRKHPHLQEVIDQLFLEFVKEGEKIHAHAYTELLFKELTSPPVFHQYQIQIAIRDYLRRITLEDRQDQALKLGFDSSNPFAPRSPTIDQGGKLEFNNFIKKLKEESPELSAEELAQLDQVISDHLASDAYDHYQVSGYFSQGLKHACEHYGDRVARILVSRKYADIDVHAESSFQDKVITDDLDMLKISLEDQSIAEGQVVLAAMSLSDFKQLQAAYPQLMFIRVSTGAERWNGRLHYITTLYPQLKQWQQVALNRFEYLLRAPEMVIAPAVTGMMANRSPLSPKLVKTFMDKSREFVWQELMLPYVRAGMGEAQTKMDADFDALTESQRRSGRVPYISRIANDPEQSNYLVSMFQAHLAVRASQSELLDRLKRPYLDATSRVVFFALSPKTQPELQDQLLFQQLSDLMEGNYRTDLDLSVQIRGLIQDVKAQAGTQEDKQHAVCVEFAPKLIQGELQCRQGWVNLAVTQVYQQKTSDLFKAYLNKPSSWSRDMEALYAAFSSDDQLFQMRLKGIEHVAKHLNQTGHDPLLDTADYIGWLTGGGRPNSAVPRRIRGTFVHEINVKRGESGQLKQHFESLLDRHGWSKSLELLIEAWGDQETLERCRTERFKTYFNTNDIVELERYLLEMHQQGQSNALFTTAKGIECLTKMTTPFCQEGQVHQATVELVLQTALSSLPAALRNSSDGRVKTNLAQLTRNKYSQHLKRIEELLFNPANAASFGHYHDLETISESGAKDVADLNSRIFHLLSAGLGDEKTECPFDNKDMVKPLDNAGRYAIAEYWRDELQRYPNTAGAGVRQKVDKDWLIKHLGAPETYRENWEHLYGLHQRLLKQQMQKEARPLSEYSLAIADRLMIQPLCDELEREQPSRESLRDQWDKHYMRMVQYQNNPQTMLKAFVAQLRAGQYGLARDSYRELKGAIVFNESIPRQTENLEQSTAICQTFIAEIHRGLIVEGREIIKNRFNCCVKGFKPLREKAEVVLEAKEKTDYYPALAQLIDHINSHPVPEVASDTWKNLVGQIWSELNIVTKDQQDPIVAFYESIKHGEGKALAVKSELILAYKLLNNLATKDQDQFKTTIEHYIISLDQGTTVSLRQSATVAFLGELLKNSMTRKMNIVLKSLKSIEKQGSTGNESRLLVLKQWGGNRPPNDNKALLRWTESVLTYFREDLPYEVTVLLSDFPTSIKITQKSWSQHIDTPMKLLNWIIPKIFAEKLAKLQKTYCEAVKIKGAFGQTKTVNAQEVMKDFRRKFCELEQIERIKDLCRRIDQHSEELEFQERLTTLDQFASQIEAPDVFKKTIKALSDHAPSINVAYLRMTDYLDSLAKDGMTQRLISTQDQTFSDDNFMMVSLGLDPERRCELEVKINAITRDDSYKNLHPILVARLNTLSSALSEQVFEVSERFRETVGDNLGFHGKKAQSKQISVSEEATVADITLLTGPDGTKFSNDDPSAAAAANG